MQSELITGVENTTISQLEQLRTPGGKRISVREAYAVCKRITRDQGPNFSVGFIFLPRAKQDAIHAIYSFCRIADDIVDESTADNRGELLAWWLEELDRCFAGHPTHPVSVALADAAERYPIPQWPLRGLIDGCQDDLVKHRYETFDALLGYCDKVATTISVLSLSVFGAATKEAFDHGKALSTALQLSNIIRDVGDDVDRGRIYIPQDELTRFGCTEEDILQKKQTKAFMELMAFQLDRTLDYFDRAYPVVSMVDVDARRAVHLMGSVYCAILAKIRSSGFQVFGPEAQLSLPEKLQVIARSFGLLGKGFRRG